MKLILNGKELDNTIEHDLNLDNEFGYNFEIIYNSNFYGFKEGSHFIYYNFNNIHYLYKSIPESNKRIAFESDSIKRMGFYRDIYGVDSVTITEAKEIHLEPNKKLK